uniref:Transposase n=1 Tax=Eptatretus burgeri TaxID=7764 RepID=A0A8C4WUA4_EPTBU
MKKAIPYRSEVKVMLIAFFDMEGMVHAEFLPKDATVNAAFCMEVMKRLQGAVRRKRPEKWKNRWLLHHDNVPCHTPLSIQQLLVSKNIPVVPHPPYSPDMAPCMPGVGLMARMVGLGSEGPEFKSHSAVELIPGGVDSACHPSEVGKMSASMLVSCVGVATRPGLCPIAKETG